MEDYFAVTTEQEKQAEPRPNLLNRAMLAIRSNTIIYIDSRTILSKACARQIKHWWYLETHHTRLNFLV